MAEIKLRITLLDGLLAICEFSTQGMFQGIYKNPQPPVDESRFFSLTMTDEEVSVVCREEEAHKDVKCEKGWRCFKVQGPLDFALTGIIASIATPLADAGISMFPIATFRTDYFLVKQEHLEGAIRALTNCGHTID